MRPGFPATIVVLGLMLALLGGCGDDRVEVNNAYVASTDRVVRTFENRFQALQADFTPMSTPAQDQKTLVSMQSAVADVVLALGKIVPPDDIRDLHVRLLTRVKEYGGAIATARRGFASEDPKAVNDARGAFATKLQQVAGQVTATITTINDKLR
ncbi:hypothetical protein DSM112329_01027 [Paraconexibacter sp. AEG42_29]|uniref:Lipoprotein n=1 Tax=Paraconexibacter sp. AEG42_29 TaxID=2997339 RepID=A0AAU7ARB9_9ACTN